jgi:hypothetical protein
MNKHNTHKSTNKNKTRNKTINKTRSKTKNISTNKNKSRSKLTILYNSKNLLFTNKQSEYGLGAFANVNIPSNTIILKEKPYNLDHPYDETYIYMLIKSFLSNKIYSKQFLSLVPIKLDLKDNTFISYDLLKDGHEKYLPQLTKDQMVLYYMKLKRNMFKFDNSPGICFVGTRINHSCDPNVTYYKDNDVLIFKTIKQINKDEELFESYINYDLPKSERQKLLLERYGFVCNCNRCMSEE